MDEEIAIRLENNPDAKFDPVKTASEEYLAQASLQKEAIEYAAAEELAVLLLAKNQNLPASQIPPAELPKIPEAAQDATAGTEPVQ